jgi:integrase/recombinase XerD
MTQLKERTTKVMNHVEDYLAHRAAQNASPATIEIRGDQLKRFLLYLERAGITRIQAVNLKTVEAYRFRMIEDDFSPNTIEQSLRALQMFFRFLREKNVIPKDPIARYKIHKAPVEHGPIFTDKEIQRLMAMPDITKPTGIRDRALLEMLYSTGMRLGEAAALSVRDVDLEPATVTVKDKFNKRRILPLGEHATKYLRLYVEEARQKFLPKFMAAPEELWINHFHKRISSGGPAKILRHYAGQVGLVITPHTLRRTCATRMLRAGTHPAVVIKILGFSSALSLSVYLQTTIPDLMNTPTRGEPEPLQQSPQKGTLQDKEQ